MENKIIFIGFNCSYYGGRGGGVLLVMVFRGKLRPKGVPVFQASGIRMGRDFTS